jgi:hypothetical protein
MCLSSYLDPKDFFLDLDPEIFLPDSNLDSKTNILALQFLKEWLSLAFICILKPVKQKKKFAIEKTNILFSFKCLFGIIFIL